MRQSKNVLNDTYLANLGEQRWELAGAAIGEHGQVQAFFKRVKR